MSLSFRMMLLAAALPLAVGCAGPEEMAAPVQTAPPVLVALPEPTPEPPLFPAARLDTRQAEILLAGDPMALRFLALKALADKGEVARADASPRRDNNMGALLPLTALLPPAAGLDRPIPPVDTVVDHVTALGSGKGRGTDATRNAERAFLLDSLLPKSPAARQPYAPADLVSARALRERLGRLEDAGLVTPEERAEETAALEKLMASGTLPERFTAEAPPPPPAPAKKKTGSGGRGSRLAGGVSGKLEVIPSPPGVTPPPLKSGAKGPAGVHLLSMGTPVHGEKAWDALKKEHAELAELGYKVSRADLGDLGATYRLIAGPMEPVNAEKLCATLKPRGQTCIPTPFPAQ